MAEQVTKTANVFNWTAGVCWNKMTKMSNKNRFSQTKLVSIDKLYEHKNSYTTDKEIYMRTRKRRIVTI